MERKYEILAPAGSFEALVAAVQNGANAVYLSGRNFGARKFAPNFSNEELIEAVRYCHIRDVDVYVTVNTLVLNHEFDRLREYIDFLYLIGVDAVIVQDIGVLDHIRKTYHDLQIHCSTQMSVQTVEDIKFLESLGANRVVLGREMTVEDIKKAKNQTNVQLEVFIHGALCISVSGQCLMSSMIGGRSGNRGSCAQPCRQKYSLYNSAKDEKHQSPHGDYLLSPRDLNTLDSIKAVLDAGAFSLKIEGRMKSAEYVAAVVRAYRLMIEALGNHGHVDVQALEQDLRIFNRGFTKGHLFGECGSGLMSMYSPGNQGYYLGKVVGYDKKRKKVSVSLSTGINQNDEIQIRRKNETIGGRVEKLEYKGAVTKKCHKGQICEVNFKHICEVGERVYKTYDEEFVKQIKQTFDKEYLQIPVSMKANVKRGTQITCSLSDGKHTVLDETDIIPQSAIQREVTVQEIKTQLSKLGGTPYQVENIEVDLDEGLSVSAKEINGIRRRLVEMLNQARVAKYNRKSKLSNVVKRKITNKNPKELELTYSIRNVSQLKKLLKINTAIIYYRDLQTLPLALEAAKESNFRGKIIPEIWKLTSDTDLYKIKNLIEAMQLDTVLIQGYGHINTFNGLKLIGDFNLNVINDFSFSFYLQNNFERITLSPELNLSQISSMGVEPARTEVLGYGYIPVMTMKHCVISTTLNKPKNCRLCDHGSYYIIDKMNERFKIVTRDHCNTEIYNSKKLMLVEYSKKLESAGVGYFRLNFLDETPEEVEMVVDIHQKYLAAELSDDDDRLNKVKGSGVTGGHISRGL